MTVCVPEHRVVQFAEQVLLTAGVDESVATETARGLWQASIRGVDTHGIRLLPHYVDEINGGRINPSPEFSFAQSTACIGQLDADDGFGIAAGKVAMEQAIDLAKDVGAGHVSVKNSSHCGAMAFFSLLAAEEDMIGYATTHGTANTLTPRGNRPFFGNNPICVAAPMAEEDPFCFDAAMTPIPFNKVLQARDLGESLPHGSAATDEGFETTDPHEATQLQYIGDYKGFGLAIINDIYCGLLSGMPIGQKISSMFGDPLSEPRNLGHYFSAIRIDAFVDPDEFKQRLQRLAETVRSEPARTEDSPVLFPGDPEKQMKQQRLDKGIPIPIAEMKKLDALADSQRIESLSTHAQPQEEH